ncbi:MAG TPA: tripartite tricarboxylate transporter substrate binding protein, partial [Reyranellaceae bacterium]|nr:tripartite tricarboxylate transporter substrate binding protein [Reyranellaceae bacterium]
MVKLLSAQVGRAWLMALLAFLAAPAVAQDFPTRPIKLVVGAPPGGTTDLLARSVGSEMAKTLGQAIIVENRGGAGGNIAAESVAKSPADGYTLLMCFTSHSINASLYKKLPFDPEKDFTPIALIARAPSLLVAHPSVKANNAAELIAIAKAQPGKLNFAIGGTGSSLHLAGDLLKSMAGIDITNVNYKGTAPALNDVLAGHVELMFISVLTGSPHVRTGRLKLLGVSSAQRLASFPEAPPIGDALPGYESSAWFGLLGPAGLPPAVLSKLSQAAIAASGQPEFRERLAAEDA